MNFETPNLLPAVPEIFVLSMACLILVIDLFVSDRGRALTHLLSLATLVGAIVLTTGLYSGGRVLTFSGSFINDDLANVLKSFIYIITAAVFIYSRRYLSERDLFKGEFYVLALFGVLGMMVMVSAYSLLTIYLGLELLSLSLYAMVALNRDSSVSSEAAMKYFILGALASGLLLYGMSMIYGVTGSLNIVTIAQVLGNLKMLDNIVLIFGLVFIIIALAFKLGAAPFHMWMPDVYHGAPTPVTLYIATAPKIAAFAMLIRLLVEGLGDLVAHWQGMLIVLAVLSMGVGNIIAIAQTNIKRMLAYSTISHVGFLLLGVLSGTNYGFSASMFYVISYAIMSLGGFGMILLLSRAGFESDRLEDFKGLNERSPWYAFMMLILMVSMAGVPPTLGFYAKLSALKAVVNADMVWLAVVAVIFSIIGAFYYLRIIKLMYFDKPDEGSQPITANFDMRVIISTNGLAVLALGIYPAGLMALCMSVFA